MFPQRSFELFHQFLHVGHHQDLVTGVAVEMPRDDLAADYGLSEPGREHEQAFAVSVEVPDERRDGVALVVPRFWPGGDDIGHPVGDRGEGRAVPDIDVDADARQDVAALRRCAVETGVRGEHAPVRAVQGLGAFAVVHACPVDRAASGPFGLDDPLLFAADGEDVRAAVVAAVDDAHVGESEVP